jgi:hypothetical protein
VYGEGNELASKEWASFRSAMVSLAMREVWWLGSKRKTRERKQASW